MRKRQKVNFWGPTLAILAIAFFATAYISGETPSFAPKDSEINPQKVHPQIDESNEHCAMANDKEIFKTREVQHTHFVEPPYGTDPWEACNYLPSSVSAEVIDQNDDLADECQNEIEPKPTSCKFPCGGYSNLNCQMSANPGGIIEAEWMINRRATEPGHIVVRCLVKVIVEAEGTNYYGCR